MGMVVFLGSTNVNAGHYIVQEGDNINKIISTLGFNSLEESGIKSVPSGDFSKIFPGDEINYKTKKHFFRQKHKVAKVDTKFCFKDTNSIHYKSSQRCK